MHSPENRPTHVLQEAAAHAACRQWLPHPAVVVLLWLLVAIALQSLRVAPLLAAGLFLTGAALKISARRLYGLLRRTRWIMFSLLVIYGYVTPGEALWAHAGTLSPTVEGLTDGLLQLSRLAFALAALSIVLALLSQHELAAGLYTLAYPLRWFGVSRERFAARLALTLYYAETAVLRAGSWRRSIEDMLAPPEAVQHDQEGASPDGAIKLYIAPIRPRDIALIAGGCITLALVLL